MINNARKTPLQEYIDRHRLSVLDVAGAAHVRLGILWNACRGRPVTPANATAIRGALARLTGQQYVGEIAVTAPVIDLAAYRERKSGGTR